MLAQRHIYLSDDPGEPVVHHPAGTIRDLLPGLEHRDESAPPLRGRPGQQFHRTDQARDVHVVSARVHDRSLVSVRIRRHRRAGIVQTRLLPDRQCVHIGAQQHTGAVPVVQNAHHAGAAHIGVHLASRGPQSVGHLGRGARLLMRQLRMGMQVAVEVLLVRADLVQTLQSTRHDLSPVVGSMVPRSGYRTGPRSTRTCSSRRENRARSTGPAHARRSRRPRAPAGHICAAGRLGTRV